MGVPQGCILSVTLFSVKINSIVNANNPGLECSLYVDDFVICFRSKNTDIIERQLQQGLNKLQTWSDENDFKFSKTKTKCMHFCNKRGSTQTQIFIWIILALKFKFLIVIFDPKLSSQIHIFRL